MLALTFLILLLVVIGVLARGSPAGPLDPLERLYLLAAPVPTLLTLVLPGIVAGLLGSRGEARERGLWLNRAGGWLSLAGIAAGALLLNRRSRRRRAWDRRLVIGLLLAALPAVLVALLGLMYAILGSNV
ncbi:MAG TPA: hypothetical protein VFJ92_08975 [Gemmatimonadales bacterium]|nr:hypothetical protein [Gemmatimonadales bacterium]